MDYRQSIRERCLERIASWVLPGSARTNIRAAADILAISTQEEALIFMETEWAIRNVERASA